MHVVDFVYCVQHDKGDDSTVYTYAEYSRLKSNFSGCVQVKLDKLPDGKVATVLHVVVDGLTRVPQRATTVSSV